MNNNGSLIVTQRGSGFKFRIEQEWKIKKRRKMMLKFFNKWDLFVAQ